MKSEYASTLQKSRTKHKDILRHMKHLSKLNKSGFDQDVWRLHDEVFAEYDCLQCGHCCRAISPRFRDTDIKLLCKATGISSREFMEKYLKQDEEGVGYVLKEEPCPFQEADNRCSVYAERTLSCRNFPHTQERGIQKLLIGLAQDSLVCPAAFVICEKIIEQY